MVFQLWESSDALTRHNDVTLTLTWNGLIRMRRLDVAIYEHEQAQI